MPNPVPAETAEQLQNRLVELFVQLVGTPDDTAVAEEADRTLERLDALLAEAAA